MKLILSHLMIPALLLAGGGANAQSSDTATKWSIQQCFQYARDHNIQLGLDQLSKATAQQNLAAAKGALVPNLTAAADNNFLNGKNDVQGNGTYIDQLSSSGNYTVSSTIVLWKDGFIKNNIRQQDLLTQSADLLVRQTFNNITLTITQAYLNILLAKENLKYVTDLDSASAARVKQGEMFFDAGSIAKKDLLQLKAQLASDNYLLVQTRNAIRQNILTLQQILQLPGDTLFDIVSPASLEVQDNFPALEQVKQSAVNNFPEIKIGQLGINIASLDIEKAKAAFKPVISASGAIGSGYNGVIIHPYGSKPGYFPQLNHNFYQQAGVSATWSIFSNRLNETNLEKARISFKAASLTLQGDKLVLTQAVEQAYLAAVNARQSFEAASEQLAAASEILRIANEQFAIGSINTYDLLQQRNQYVQAVQSYTQAKYNAVLQRKIYEFYMGSPVSL